MYKTFILVTQEAEKLGAKHLPFFFETPCTFDVRGPSMEDDRVYTILPEKNAYYSSP